MIVPGVERLHFRRDTLLMRLHLIDEYDRDMERRNGRWRSAAIAVFCAGFVSTVVVHVTGITSTGMFLFLIVLPALLACMTMAWHYGRLDLDDRKVAVARRLVTMLGADIPATELVDITVDVRAYDRAATVVGRSGSRVGINVTTYRHAWLTLRARLADGNVLVLSIVDRITRRQKRKTAGSKTKYKIRERCRSYVRVSVRLAKPYRPAAAVAGRLRTVAAVPGLTLASVTPSADGARLIARFRSATVLSTAALPAARPVLGALRWLYAGLSLGARRRA